MAELYKFQDKVKSPERRVKPIVAREIDENFTAVRLKVASPVEAMFTITPNFPLSDELGFGFDVPATGTYVLGFIDGVFTLLETEAC